MSTTTRRFFSPNGTTHGSVDITTVKQITINKNWTRLASQGDADLTDTFQAKVNLQVSGTIVVEDAIQADALLDAANDTLSWSGVPEAGGTAKVETVDGVEFFSMAETDAHNAIDGITLGWNAYSPTGVDPHSADLAT